HIENEQPPCAFGSLRRKGYQDWPKNQEKRNLKGSDHVLHNAGKYGLLLRDVSNVGKEGPILDFPDPIPNQQNHRDFSHLQKKIGTIWRQPEWLLQAPLVAAELKAEAETYQPCERKRGYLQRVPVSRLVEYNGEPVEQNIIGQIEEAEE